MNANTQRLAGKVAAITGAGAGIGEGIARAAAELGMKLVLADISGDRVEVVAASLQEDGMEVLAATVDVTCPDQLDALAARACERFGGVDLLVNNAGVELLGFIWEIPAATWRRAIDINVLGVIHGLRAFLPGMLASGRPGWVANLSSVGGLGMSPLQAGYIVSKHAVLSLTECLALEMAVTNSPISVSAVLPGPVVSQIFQDAPREGAGPMLEAHREYMKTMLRDHGLSAFEAGRRILAGIAAGDFWVSPHPEMMAEAADNRASFLKSLNRPALSEKMRLTLGEIQPS